MAKKKKSNTQNIYSKWANIMAGGIPPGMTSQVVGQPSSTSFPSLLPVSMKIAAKAISQDLVSVQPLSAPVGQIWYTDFVYGGSRPLTEFEKIVVERMEALTGKTWWITDIGERVMIVAADCDPNIHDMKKENELRGALASRGMELEEYVIEEKRKFCVPMDKCTLYDRGEKVGHDTGIL